jgi:hypothetical protein
MCLPQDPATRGLMRVDPLAKATGLSDKYAKHSARLNPLESKINKADPIQRSFDQPKVRTGNLLTIQREVQ